MLLTGFGQIYKFFFLFGIMARGNLETRNKRKDKKKEKKKHPYKIGGKRRTQK